MVGAEPLNTVFVGMAVAFEAGEWYIGLRLPTQRWSGNDDHDHAAATATATSQNHSFSKHVDKVWSDWHSFANNIRAQRTFLLQCLAAV